MRFPVFFAALTILACSATTSSPLNRREADIQHVLGKQLSPGARIVFPDDSDWHELTDRWDPYSVPKLRVAVEVATAGDVQATVRYAAKRKIPLLVRNSSHGFTKTVENVVDGIQIGLHLLNTVNVDKKRNLITLGGGVNNFQLVEALYNAKKRTATGGCDCVGVMGLGLGGGHGKLQGLHGLVADVIDSAEMVLADGRLVTVSANENKDLYWAIRGAGHNFGIVTKVKLKIFDVKDNDIWINADYIYDPSKLEAVFSYLNGLRNTQPDEMTIFSSFLPNSANPEAPPNVRVSIQYGGQHADYPKLAQPFLDIGPISTSNATVAWNKIAEATGIGLGKGFCVGGIVSRGHFSAQLISFNIPAIRETFDFYNQVIHKHPEFVRSGLAWESYPLKAFKAVSGRSTAYPHRDMNIISLFMVNYEDPALESLAIELGKKGRELLHKGSGVPDLRVYVNYAQGDEGEKVWYGGGWRNKKLRALKKQYDPQGAFNAYNPILL